MTIKTISILYQRVMDSFKFWYSGKKIDDNQNLFKCNKDPITDFVIWS